MQANIGLSSQKPARRNLGAAQVACARFIKPYPEAIQARLVNVVPPFPEANGNHRIAVVLKRPKLLVLDEATSALDVDTEQQVTRNLAEVYRGHGFIHYPSPWQPAPCRSHLGYASRRLGGTRQSH